MATKNKIPGTQDPLFILRGDDGEIYMIHDSAMVRKLDAKILELQGMDDDEIGKHLLALVNPERYQQYGR